MLYYITSLFVLGICFGSFINVLVDRIPTDKPLFLSRSECDYCKHKLNALDLIPILSFLCLKGSCRYCHKKLSLYYPLVELVTGILFVLNFLVFNNYYQLIFSLFVTSSLVTLFFVDLKFGLLPDKIIYPTTIFIILFSPLIRDQKTFLEDLLVAAILAVFFLLTIIFTKGRGMGMGDVKFAFLIGIILGWQKAILAIFLAFIAGALVGVFLILLKKKKLNQSIPFGPFLALSTYISLIFGDNLIKFYLSNFLNSLASPY